MSTEGYRERDLTEDFYLLGSTVPVEAVNVWRHPALAGDKHSLNNYPRADEIPPTPAPEATVLAFKPRTEESA